MKRLVAFFGNSRSGTNAVSDWMSQNIFKVDIVKPRGAFSGKSGKKNALRSNLRKISNPNKDTLVLFESRKIEEFKYFNEHVSKKNLNVDYSIILLRDLFNWMSSWVSYMEKWKGYGDKKKLDRDAKAVGEISVWTGYAKEFCNKTNIVPNKVLINFDKWNSDPSYRSGILEQFNISVPEAISSVKGSRSSFPDDHQLKFNNRWEMIKGTIHEKRYNSILSNFASEETLGLYKEIFGETDAYREFISKNS